MCCESGFERKDTLRLFYMEVDQIANFDDIEKSQDADKQKEVAAKTTQGTKAMKKKKQKGKRGADGSDDDDDANGSGGDADGKDGAPNEEKRDRHKSRLFLKSMDRVRHNDLYG